MLKWVPLVAVWASIALSGCASSISAPDAPLVDQTQALKAWSEVLKTAVDSQGRIDFASVAHHPGNLNLYLKYISAHSPKETPEEFPTRESQIAFYLNSYNALALFNMIRRDPIPEELTAGKRLGFFIGDGLDVGHYYLSLYRYENEVIRPMGEERVHFALNCMVRGCPRLPQKEFTANHLETELDEQAHRFLNEDRNIRIDPREKKVFLSSILHFYTADFLKKAPTLIDYVNRYRKDKIPTDYQIDFIPYDWTVNVQPPHSS